LDWTNSTTPLRSKAAEFTTRLPDPGGAAVTYPQMTESELPLVATAAISATASAVRATNDGLSRKSAGG
jgi:hypothetical protein